MLRVTTQSIAIRTAKAGDADGLAAVHDGAWRFAYRGVLPGRELERMIARRGPDWWGQAVRKRVPIIVLDAGDRVRGYATYGASRVRTLPFRAEIYELYIQPEYAGLGYGTRMFRTVQQRLARRGHSTLVVWCLADNAIGCAFYEKLGGKVVATAQEELGGVMMGKLAFAFERPKAVRLRP